MSEQNPYAPPGAEVTIEQARFSLASRGARLGGSFIDGIIMMVVIWSGMFLTGYWDRAIAGEQAVAETALFGALGIAVFFLVNGYLLATSGQTVGKRLVGTRIVSVESDQIMPLWKVAVLRYIPFQAAGLFPLLGPIVSLVNPLFIFREDRRCLHDLVAGSKVIKVE